MRRTILLIFFLTLLVTVLYLIRQDNLKNQNLPTIVSTPTIIPTPTPTPKQTVKVTKVIDGDTITIESGEKVRLIGIDAPELEGENSCYSQESKKYLQELIENKDVFLEKDISESDKYDRLLRYVTLDNLFVNKDLLSKGYAVLATYSPDIKYVEDFELSAKQAKNQLFGLYGACQ